MIVSLIGYAGSGKSTFAKWFLKRNPSWVFLPIDEVRDAVQQEYLDLDCLAGERLAWDIIKEYATSSEDCIVESTGLAAGLEKIHECPDCYTIKFTLDSGFARELVNRRARAKIKYEFDDYPAGEEDLIDELAANVLVNTKHIISGIVLQQEAFERVERLILKAQRYYDCCRMATQPAGLNINQ